MAQALVRRRLGLRRFPVVTAVVFAATAVTSVLGLAEAEVLAAWQRTPEGLHGDWWRSFTSLLVQDGGVPGTLSNLVFLAAGTRLPRLAPVALLWWCGALLASRWGAVPLLVLVAGAVAVQLAPPGWAVRAGRLAAAAGLVALVLVVARDLHGAALTAGIVIAAATGRRALRPER